MGGAVSSGRDNSDLVDNLIDAEYIVSKQAESAFRAVDRGDYFLDEFRASAYKDCAWRQGPLHLSAPCIYTKVVEALDLRPGLTFLNLGCGTGYFSTVVGLLLGSRGINHGVELHAEAVAYAETKLSEFKKNALAFDEFDFCEPLMIIGNCLQLAGCSQYDRVYCGAACPEEHVDYVKSLIKIGGILVVPVDDKLLRIQRTGETSWESRSILSVSFATLVAPESSSTEIVSLPETSVPSLRDICRTNLRAVLRAKLQQTLPQPDFRRPKRADGSSDSEVSNEGSRSQSRSGHGTRRGTERGAEHGTERGDLIQMLYHLQRSSSSSSSSSGDAEDDYSANEAAEGSAEEEAGLQHFQHHAPPDHDMRDHYEPVMQSPDNRSMKLPVLRALDVPPSERERAAETNRSDAIDTNLSLMAGISKRKADGSESLPAGRGDSSSGVSSSGSSCCSGSHSTSKRRHTCVHCRQGCLSASVTANEFPGFLPLDSSSCTTAAAHSAGEPCIADAHDIDQRLTSAEATSNKDLAEVAATGSAATKKPTTAQCAFDDDSAATPAVTAAVRGTSPADAVNISATEALPRQLHVATASEPRQVELQPEERAQRIRHVIQLSLGRLRSGAAARADGRRGDRDVTEEGTVVVGLFGGPAAAIRGRRDRAVSESECLPQHLGEHDSAAVSHEDTDRDNEEAEFVRRRQVQHDYHRAFSSTMMAFIEALPLPDSLKVFLTYGRRKACSAQDML